MGNHSLNPNIANKYGHICALILQNIFYWVTENEKNKKETHFHNGYYWTYNSVREFSEYFTYLTPRQIRSALEILKENELILTANFNNSCNRTLWYTVTQKAIDIMNNNQEEAQEDFSNPDDKSIIIEETNASESRIEEQKCQNDLSPASNGFDTQVKTICHTCQMDLTSVANGTNNKPQIITANNREKEIYKEKEPPDKVIFDFWNSKRLRTADKLDNYLKTVINNLLKFFTLDSLLLAVDRYDEIYNSNNYFDHSWSFKEFLKAEKINKFLDNGDHWINYCSWKKKQQSSNGFIHNTYTSEQIASLVTNLDEVAV